jgi:hypothetical protein
MATQHTLPAPPAIIRRACEQVIAVCGRLPLVRKGVEVNADLLIASIEELNAEPNRTLAIRARTGKGGRVTVDGLDRHLATRGFDIAGVAGCVYEVLTKAAITGKASVADRYSRKFLKGIRLLPAWTWTVETGTGDFRAPVTIPFSAAGTNPAWTDTCPVCRDGRLEPATGQRLFGVYGTDFLACTSCTARFVPDSGGYRLVTIPGNRDPEWERLLNRSLGEEEWQAVARGGSVPDLTKRGMVRPAGAGNRAYPDKGRQPAFAQYAVESGGKVLYFRPFLLQFGKGKTVDLFARRKDPLHTILGLPAYRDCADFFRTRYPGYLDLPVGFFLSELKNRRDPAFQQILNPYGDGIFCSFHAARTGIAEKKGIYIIVQNGSICASGMSLRPFLMTINEELGSIMPETCYRDGNPESCRINALVCGNRSCGGGIYVYPIEKETDIVAMATGIEADRLRLKLPFGSLKQ